MTGRGIVNSLRKKQRATRSPRHDLLKEPACIGNRSIRRCENQSRSRGKRPGLLNGIRCGRAGEIRDRAGPPQTGAGCGRNVGDGRFENPDWPAAIRAMHRFPLRPFSRADTPPDSFPIPPESCHTSDAKDRKPRRTPKICAHETRSVFRYVRNPCRARSGILKEFRRFAGLA